MTSISLVAFERLSVFAKPLALIARNPPMFTEGVIEVIAESDMSLSRK